MMGRGNFTDAFKRDAVAQIPERGYPIKEVSERLEASLHSLYAWKRKFAKAATGETDRNFGIRRLKRELARVSEERDMDFWADQRGVVLDFSRTRKPTDNAFIEAFNGRFRAECLNQRWFLTLADAVEKLEA